MNELIAQDEQQQLLKGTSEDGAGDHGGDERVNVVNRFLLSSKDLGFPLVSISPGSV